MNAALPSLDLRRAEARERFRTKGVPHRRIEEWKYSDLRAVLNPDVVQREVEEAAVDPFAEVAGPRFLITNGVLRSGISTLPDGVEAFDLSSATESMPDWIFTRLGVLAADQPMAAASLGFMRGGIALRVQANVRVSETFHILLAGGGYCRALVVLEEGAHLTLTETISENLDGSDSEFFIDSGVEFFLEDGAKLSHVRLAANAAKSIQVETIAVKAAAGASYRAHFANFGAKLSRVDMNIVLEGESAEAHLSGATVLADGHADITTHIVHSAGNTRSTQLFKNVAGGHSRGVYQGKITVREGANGSDSRQSAKGLLLGERAEIDLKPELEIFADDVKCAHGAAVGDLDVDSLFYLRARGIPESEARALLIRAFLEDAVAEIENEEIRAVVWRDVESALARANEAAP